MLVGLLVLVGVVIWAGATIALDQMWRRKREGWAVQLAARGIADEAWEWLNSR